MRRSRLEPRRAHGSLRHERRLQRPHRRLRRACCGTTATARSRRAPTKAGIAAAQAWHSAAAVGDVDGNGKPRPLRDVLCRPERQGRVDGRLPVEPPPAPRPALPQRRHRTTRVARRFREVVEGCRHRAEARRTRARRGVHRRRPRRTTRPVRRERHRSEPALPQHPGDRRRGQPRLPLRGSREAARGGRPERRHGRRGGRLQPGRPRRPVRHELARAAPRRVSEPHERRAPPYADARPDIAAVIGTRLDRVGQTPGPTSTSTATSTWPWRTARFPVVDLAKDAQRIQILENVSLRNGQRPASRSSTRLRPPAGALRQRARTRNGRLRQRRRPRHRRQRDRRAADPPREQRRVDGRWLEVRLRTLRARRAGHRRLYPTAGASSARCSPGASYLSSEDPRVHFGLGNAKRSSERLTIRFPDGHHDRPLRNVAADRVVDVG